MPTERIEITSEDQWLDLRKRDVTASVIAAVRGLHPYVPYRRLFYEKAGVIEFPPEDNAVFERGQVYEPAGAKAVARQRPDWQIEKCNSYYRDPDLRIGATPDYLIVNDPRGLAPLDIKVSAPAEFERNWPINEAGAISPPFYVTVQVLTQSMLLDAAFGVVGCLILTGYKVDCRIIEIPRHPAAEQRIRDDVAQFWQDVAEGKEPEDDKLDRTLLQLLLPKETPQKVVDLSADNEIISALVERSEIRQRIKVDEERCQTIEALLMSKMKDAERATVPDFRVTWRTEQRTGYTVPTKPLRVLRIKDQRT